MKGSIRITVGFLMILGVVGRLETDLNFPMYIAAPLLIVGLLISVSGIYTIKMND
jgi:hypothetical protein